ncbi:unnamed protein product [Amoebophrya sp. A25]|nr:unnamed protein product [Amoebophrya sp. A25]|eukprot:GSA25T00011198001.1
MCRLGSLLSAFLVLRILYSDGVLVVNAQITKPPTTSTLALSNGFTIYHPIVVTNKTRCWPLKPELCPAYKKANPWNYAEWLNQTEWGPRRPPVNTSVVHRRLSQGCIPGLTGLQVQFPLQQKNGNYELYWGDGRLFLPFPQDTAPVPGLGLNSHPLTACKPELPMAIREIDPNPQEIIAQNLPSFDIGPMHFCTHEKAKQQCCWMECGYYIMDARIVDRDGMTQPNGPICWFALEHGELPILTDPDQRIDPDYSVWRVQRQSEKEREDQINEEALNPSGMLSFGGITQDTMQFIDLERDYPKQRMFAGISKTVNPCAFCHTRGDYDAENKLMSVQVIYEPHVIQPLLQLGGFPTFDHWVASGNRSGGWLYDFFELPILTDDEIKNLTNRDAVLATQIQYNNMQRSGLRLYVKADNYFVESRFHEDESYWPEYPFFQPGGKNWNCYPGRSVPVPDLIPWARPSAASRGSSPGLFRLIVALCLYVVLQWRFWGTSHAAAGTTRSRAANLASTLTLPSWNKISSEQSTYGDAVPAPQKQQLQTADAPKISSSRRSVSLSLSSSSPSCDVEDLLPPVVEKTTRQKHSCTIVDPGLPLDAHQRQNQDHTEQKRNEGGPRVEHEIRQGDVKTTTSLTASSSSCPPSRSRLSDSISRNSFPTTVTSVDDVEHVVRRRRRKRTGIEEDIRRTITKTWDDKTRRRSAKSRYGRHHEQQQSRWQPWQHTDRDVT